ncbi:MAG: tetratricopeptide repeat protein [Isosphaeraceae bacterium]
MRRLDPVFLVILLTVVAVLGGGTYLAHGIQIRRNATALLGHARRAESGEHLETAEQSLSQYLKIKREDGSTWKWYARVVDQQDSDRRGRERVFLVHEEALRYNPGDPELERRCADLALELGRYKEAQSHLMSLLEKAENDTQGQPAAAAQAELEDLLGQCSRGLTLYEDAGKWFEKSIQHDRGRVACYDRLARLRRTELRRIEAGDGTIRDMIARNPQAGRAYIYRWRYAQEFAPPADAADIPRALVLAPDDPEVLLTAAVSSEQKQDLKSARTYFENGFKLDPRSSAFALGLARQEIREGHLDRAEAVLRRAHQANPSVTLAFYLAEILISQDKFAGKDQAAGYIELLQTAGFGDTLVRFLEAESLFQRKEWKEAIPRLEMARAVLQAEPQLVTQLNLMLAECHGRTGDEEQRLDALHQAAEGDRGPESARLELAQALVRSGKLDQAVTILQPMASSKPEWRLDLVRLLVQRTIRQPEDRRNWPEVERSLREAEQALPQSAESLTLLRLDVLTARNRLEDARALLTAALASDPKNLKYQLALARLTQRQRQGELRQQGESPPEPSRLTAMQIIDQAEKDLGPSLEIQLARLDCWGMEGGDVARAAVAKLAETRQQVSAAGRPVFLDRLATVEIQLGDPKLARQYGRELAALQPENLGVRLRLFDLALAAGDHADAAQLVDEVRKAEGEQGTLWRFARAALLIDQVRRGSSQNLDEARRLAAEIAARRPQWSSSFSLNGELAELAGSPEEAITSYLRAVELGDTRPLLVRRLVVLLNERNRVGEIDRLTQVLRDQGATVGEVTIARALDALRKGNFDQGLALARQLFPESSTNSSDHLELGRFYAAAGRSDEAGQEFRRAVELGRGVPDNWMTYIEYLTRAKRIDEARAAVDAAGKALPADRSALTLARCWLLVGDLGQAEASSHKVLEGQPHNPAALKLAATVALTRNRPDQVEDYLRQLDRSADASPADKVWANRIRVALLLGKNRPADRDRALALIDQNLANTPDSVEDLALKATVLAIRPGGQGDAVAILERLAAANRLGVNERFLLARLYLGQRNDQKYQDEMHKLLDLKPRNPGHLVHLVNYWIARGQLDQADRWLAELKRDDPRGLSTLELEARLLDLRKRKPELLARLVAHGRDVPDQIGAVADLLNRYGFAKEAEAAYKAFIARDPKQPERALALAQFLARQDRVAEAMAILKQAWTTCRPEQVAAAALPVFEAPSVTEADQRQVEAWLATAVQKRPDAVLLASKLGAVWIHQGRFDEAEGLLRRLLAGAPENVDALNNLAWLLAMRGQGHGGDALGLIDRAIQIQGRDPALLDTRAVVLIRSGQPRTAVEDLKEAQKLNSKSPSPVRHLAWSYRMSGQLDEAKKFFRQAVEMGWKVASCDPLERKQMEELRRDLGLGGN